MRRDLCTTDDRGSAMAMVIGIMVIITIAMATLAAAVGQTTRQTASSRAHIQAQGAADAGIDRVLQWMDGKTYGELQTAGTCLPGIAPFSVDDASVTVTAQWTPRDANGCLPAGSGNGKLVVTASADQPGGLPAMSGARSVVAEFVVSTPPSPLDNAIFSEGSLSLQNVPTVTESSPGAADANVYIARSIPALNCNNGVIEGSLTVVHGDVTLQNSGCKITNVVWASGKVTVATGLELDAIYSSSKDPAAITVGNDGRFSGSLVANGGISLGRGTIGTAVKPASVWSGSGGVTGRSGAHVFGSVYSHGDVGFQEGTHIDGDVVSRVGGFSSMNSGTAIGGRVRVATTFANGNGSASPKPTSACSALSDAACSTAFPASPANWKPVETGVPAGAFNATFSEVQSPARVAFPRIYSNTPAPDGSDPNGAWVAAGWTIVKPTSAECSAIPSRLAAGVVDKTVLDLEACPSGLQLNGATISLRNDLAIISDRGFNSSNDLKVTIPAGKTYDMLWIVPADAATVSWTMQEGVFSPTCAGNTGNIWVKGAAVAPGARWFVYTPCDITFQTPVGTPSQPVEGQLYGGGRIDIAGNGSHIKMPPVDSTGARIPIPALSGGAASPAAPASVALAGRYDVPVTAP